MASGKHLPALDGLRGLAVLLVFTFHYGGGTHASLGAWRAFGLLNKAGWSGVTLFFILSGFLITGILWDSFGDPRWWTNFVARRSLRIFPLYFLALAMVVLSSLPQAGLRLVLHRIWIPALFLEDVPGLASLSDALPSPMPTFHLWSIAVEEQFYLLWPLLLAMQKTRARAKRLCLYTFLVGCLFPFLIRLLLRQPYLWNHFLLTQVAALAMGGWLALVYRGQEWARVVRVAPATLLFSLAGFIGCGLLSGGFEMGDRHMATWGLIFITVCFGSLLTLTLRPGPISRMVSIAPLRWLGKISYGVYIFHLLLLNLINHGTQALAGTRSPMVFLAVRFVVGAAVTVSAALLSYHFYESQFLKLKKRFQSRRKAARSSSRTELQAS